MAALLALLPLLALARLLPWLLALLLPLLAGSLLAGPGRIEACGLLETPAQAFELSQGAFESLLLARACGLGQALGFLRLALQVVERACHDLFALGRVRSQPAADVLGGDTEPGGDFVLLQVAQCLAQGASRLALGAVEAADRFLYLALDRFQLLLHGFLLFRQLERVHRRERAAEPATNAAGCFVRCLLLEGLDHVFA